MVILGSSAPLLTVAVLTASILGSPITHSVHEKRSGVPAAWRFHKRAPANAIVPVRIGTRQRNVEEAASILDRLSNITHPEHGQWWTSEQVIDYFAPLQETVHGITKWLVESGIDSSRISQSANKQWIQFDANIGELEDLLRTEYHVFEHEHGRKLPSCDQYHIPEHLRDHIDYITPGVNLGRATKLNKRDSTGHPTYKLPVHTQPLPGFAPLDAEDCGTVVTPDCIKAMYGITNGTMAHAGNELGIFEDLGEHYSQQDLNDFFKGVYPEIPQGTHPVTKGIDGAFGPTNVGDAGGEAALDFQIAYPIVWPQNQVLFQTDDEYYEEEYSFNGFLDNFLDAIDGSYCSYSAYGINGQPASDPPYPDPNSGGYKGSLQCGVYKPTNVISISYGGPELLHSVAYQKRQCDEYMKLGLQGVSIFISSQDNGVSCSEYDNNIFGPGFPVTCPYVTAVGSTKVPIGAQPTAQQVATTLFGSGAGFSNIFPQPAYQKAKVQNYLNVYPPPYKAYQTTNNESVGANFGQYNSIGRAYPDIAAVGQDILIYLNGDALLEAGTSASAPLVAAIFTRINEERLKKGKSTVGFVNPTLYAHPEAFHDVVSGSSFAEGCSESDANVPGFSAAPGWDPVTGMGVPNYPALVKLFS